MKKQQNLDHGAWDAVTAGAVTINDRDHLKARIERGDRLRVKLGLDPTRPDIHLGHTVVLRALRRYQEHGHKAILIIGDWTARIGDPSGQSLTRRQLTREQVNEAAQTYLDQLWKVLDKAETEVRYQSEWFDKMRLEDVVGLLSKYTVARMLTREDFDSRMKANRPVGMHEVLYPLLQAYDSVAVKSDLELGGTDQTFNLLAGRDIQTAFGQRPQDIQTMPLLVGLDGVHKMSKSLDNYIGIDEPPNVMFSKVMSIPDELILPYFTLLTQTIGSQAQTLFEHGPRDAKARLAHEIVRQFHGLPPADLAEAEFNRVFKSHGLPSYIEEVDVTPDERSVGGLFFDVGLVDSKSQAHRLVSQRGLYINGDPVKSAEETITPQSGWVLQRGSRMFKRLRVS